MIEDLEQYETRGEKPISLKCGPRELKLVSNESSQWALQEEYPHLWSILSVGSAMAPRGPGWAWALRARSWPGSWARDYPNPAGSRPGLGLNPGPIPIPRDWQKPNPVRTLLEVIWVQRFFFEWNDLFKNKFFPRKTSRWNRRIKINPKVLIGRIRSEDDDEDFEVGHCGQICSWIWRIWSLF